jgi:tetratricopeptide (TPR) repeat protein
MFSLDPANDTEDPAFVIALGHFNFDPPDRSAYNSQGKSFLRMLAAQLVSQYGLEEVSSDPIIFAGEPVFHNDFTGEVEGAQRLMRMVAIPHFDHGHGVLFAAVQKVHGSYDDAFPEFDRVTRHIIASLDFPSLEPIIGEIIFATGMTQDIEPVEPNTSFPAGIQRVYAIFEHENIFSGAEFEQVWYLDGDRIMSDVGTWGDQATGRSWVNIDHEAGMPPGSYELQLSVNGELLQTGSFVIETPSSTGTDASSWHAQGISHYQQGAYEKAIAAYSKAIELDSGFARAYNDRGLAYKASGNLERAIADFDQAIELGHDPLAWPYYNRAGAHLNLGDPERAIADYTKAVELDPTSAAAFGNRGLAYLRSGDNELATADF